MRIDFVLKLNASIVALLVFAMSPIHASNLQATHILRDGSLKVEIMDPNSPDRYNRGTRFTPIANVLRVSDGKNTYLYSPVEHNPLEDNGGLASEFDNAKLGLPGYAEAKIGEGFLKVGVGVLRKITAPKYNFLAQHEIIEPAKTEVEWGKNTALFKQTCKGVNGYSYELTALVTVSNRCIKIDWRLTNTGTKTLTTEQYSHNFFTFNENPTGPGYEIQFPYEISPYFLPDNPDKDKDSIRHVGSKLVFCSPVREFMNIRVPKPSDHVGDDSLKVVFKKTGQAILVTTQGPVIRTAVHARNSYLSPEQFIRVTIHPEESAGWSRKYEFISSN